MKLAIVTILASVNAATALKRPSADVKREDSGLKSWFVNDNAGNEQAFVRGLTRDIKNTIENLADCNEDGQLDLPCFREIMDDVFIIQDKLDASEYELTGEAEKLWTQLFYDVDRYSAIAETTTQEF